MNGYLSNNNYISLSKEQENNISQQFQKSICTLIINKNQKEYGFLCQIPNSEKKILIASIQNFRKEEISNIQNIELYFNDNNYINESNFINIFTDEILKIIIIELNNNFFLNNNNINFIKIENQYDNVNKDIYLLNNSTFNNNNNPVTLGFINFINYEKNIIEYDTFSNDNNNIFSLIIILNNYKVIGFTNINADGEGFYLKPLLDKLNNHNNSFENQNNKPLNYLKKSNIDYAGNNPNSNNHIKSCNYNINVSSSGKNNNGVNNNININKFMVYDELESFDFNKINLDDENGEGTDLVRKEFINKRNENFEINIKFFNINNDDYLKYEKKELSGLLNLCLIKIISNLFDINNIEININEELKKIIKQLRDSFNFSGDKKEDIKLILNKEKGNNILVYSEYINSVIDNEKFNYMKNFLDNNKINEMDKYWRCLSNLEEYNSFFEKEFKNDLKQTYFDYSLIGLNILESNNEKSYKQKRNECPNVVKRIMYHGTQIDAIADILTNEFKYSRRPFFGMGIYFSDMIDYITFYCGGNNFNKRRDNFGKILPVGKSFSFIASEIFYDSTKKNHIKDLSLAEKDLDYFPTYETLKRNFQNKMVQPNGIHFIQVKEDGYPIGEKTIIESDRGFVGHEYVITELYQILPIYSLTLKRNEYFVLWYDQNFSKKNDFSKDLYERKLFCDTQANMNIYCESNLFEALKFLWKRRYNKIILISSVNKDGKIFIKIARLILEFKALVLFYGDKNSSNNNIFKWIKDFENCLYTDDKAIYEYYISKFKKYELLNLKHIVEQNYNIKLKDFTDNFLSYPKYVNDSLYKEINLKEKNPYLKKVYILCEKKNRFMIMTNDGNVIDSDKPEKWEVIFCEKEICFYSKGFYLGVKKDMENVVGRKYMKNWKFKYEKGINSYLFQLEEKKEKNILSIEGTWIKVNKSKNHIGSYEIFKLIEV